MKQEDRKRKLESDDDEEEDDQHDKYLRDDEDDNRTANDMEELLATIEGDVCAVCVLLACDHKHTYIYNSVYINQA